MTPSLLPRVYTTGNRTGNGQVSHVTVPQGSPHLTSSHRGGSRDGRGGGGRGPGGQDPPPPFWGNPNFIKREKTSRVCIRKRHILVLNSCPDPLPPFRNPVSNLVTAMMKTITLLENRPLINLKFWKESH